MRLWKWVRRRDPWDPGEVLSTVAREGNPEAQRQTRKGKDQLVGEEMWGTGQNKPTRWSVGMSVSNF